MYFQVTPEMLGVSPLLTKLNGMSAFPPYLFGMHTKWSYLSTSAPSLATEDGGMIIFSLQFIDCGTQYEKANIMVSYFEPDT